MASRSAREVVTRALDDLLDSTQAVTRALLGVGTAGAAAADGGRTAGGHQATGWMAAVPGVQGGAGYSSRMHISYDE